MNFRAKNIFILPLVFTCIFALEGCVKKSVDDPVISFRSRTNRLTGNWEVESISIQNDINLLDYSVVGKSENCQENYTEQFSTISQNFDFQDDGELSQSLVELNYIYNDSICDIVDFFISSEVNASWEFNDDQTVIFVSAPGQSIIEYQIQRLSNSELEVTYETVIEFDPVDLTPSAPSFARASMKLSKN